VFASRVDGLDVSGIRKLFEAADEDAIHLGIGEPHRQPPDHVLQAHHGALDAGHNKYSPTAGLGELREAIADEHADPWPGTPGLENVAVTAGSTAGLYAAIQALVDEGDEVLVPDPGFVLYGPHTRLAKGTPVTYPLPHEEGFQIDPDALVEQVTPDTKAIVVNSPANPTGVRLAEDSVDAAADLAEDHDLWLLADEAYDAFTYDDPHESVLDRGLERVGYFNTFSKRYAMTGWRLGYAVAPEPLAEKIRVVGYHMYAAPPTPAQHAALAALEGPDRFTREMVEELEHRREVAVEAIGDVDGLDLVEPSGAIYAFPRYEADVSSMDLSVELLEAGVVVVPGSAFGEVGGGHLRLSFAADPQDIREGIQVIEKALDGR
jgi:aspartate aminotransferase